MVKAMSVIVPNARKLREPIFNRYLNQSTGVDSFGDVYNYRPATIGVAASVIMNT